MTTKYAAPHNHLKEIRENVLGWTQGRLSEVAKSQGNQISVKTISRLESADETYARTTFTRVHLAINEGLKNAGKREMEFSKLFPHLISPGDNKKPPLPDKQAPNSGAKPFAQNS